MLKAYSRSNIIARLFNTPLAVMPETATIVLGAIGDRLDVAQLFVPTDGRAFSLGELEDKASAERIKIEARGGVDRRAKTARAAHLMFVHNGVAHVGVRGETVAENGIGPMSGFTGYDGIVAQVQSADADPNVKGILLDIDSPGGEVAGLYECAGILMKRRSTKPMRALIRSMGCSAAYALACCADEVTLHDLGYAGSIGTIAMHADFSGALEQDGIKVTLFTAGAHKADGNPFEALPESVAKSIQALVDMANSRFIAHVAQARGLSEDDVIAQQAQVYRGETAVKAGLVDKVMSWQDSMDEFEQQVNGRSPSGTGATAPTGASSTKGQTMSENANAPAAEPQPEITEAALAESTTKAKAEGITEGAKAEQERITALTELDAGSTISEPLAAAIADGSSVADFALAQARAKKDTVASAAAAAKNEAVSNLPEGSAAAADPAKPGESNRGKAYAAKKQAKA